MDGETLPVLSPRAEAETVTGASLPGEPRPTISAASLHPVHIEGRVTELSVFDDIIDMDTNSHDEDGSRNSLNVSASQRPPQQSVSSRQQPQQQWGHTYTSHDLLMRTYSPATSSPRSVFQATAERCPQEFPMPSLPPLPRSRQQQRRHEDSHDYDENSPLPRSLIRPRTPLASATLLPFGSQPSRQALTSLSPFGSDTNCLLGPCQPEHSMHHVNTTADYYSRVGIQSKPFDEPVPAERTRHFSMASLPAGAFLPSIEHSVSLMDWPNRRANQGAAAQCRGGNPGGFGRLLAIRTGEESIGTCFMDTRVHCA